MVAMTTTPTAATPSTNLTVTTATAVATIITALVPVEQAAHTISQFLEKAFTTSVFTATTGITLVVTGTATTLTDNWGRTNHRGRTDHWGRVDNWRRWRWGWSWFLISSARQTRSRYQKKRRIHEVSSYR